MWDDVSAAPEVGGASDLGPPRHCKHGAHDANKCENGGPLMALEAHPARVLVEPGVAHRAHVALRALHAARQAASRVTQEARVYSHNGPIRRSKRGYILTTDQSDAGSAGIFSRRTNQTQEARVYYHEGPIGRRKRGYILTKDQSDAGRGGYLVALPPGHAASEVHLRKLRHTPPSCGSHQKCLSAKGSVRRPGHTPPAGQGAHSEPIRKKKNNKHV
eukprot:1188282-Prorocentrum_minimum.AAC.1